MALLNYLQRNKFGVSEYKRRIPHDLLDKLPFKTGFLKHSLKTKEPETAKFLKQKEDARYDALFESLFTN